ncbi:hypothetical protein EI94DRAFT_1703905 [Lactarius quietus]|nr:hypothetical protein EI94DRAFT_1703905 [Lactarius quietus]
MFTCNIIDIKTFVIRVENILAENVLFTQFKQLVNWDDRIGNAVSGLAHMMPRCHVLSTMRSPGYCQLPESEICPATSGQDQLACSMLNDEWVSHPTWHQKRHTKNLFEEVTSNKNRCNAMTAK